MEGVDDVDDVEVFGVAVALRPLVASDWGLNDLRLLIALEILLLADDTLMCNWLLYDESLHPHGIYSSVL